LQGFRYDYNNHILAVVIGNLLIEILDELQAVIWIFWNCLLLAMFDMDKIPEDVEFNKENQ
jgi:hypothetical protein